MLKGKSAIIIGASRGLGKTIALEFAKNGANLILWARNEQKLKEATKNINDSGFKCDYIKADIQDEASVNNAFAESADKCGKIDIVVNCAGIGFWAEVKDTSLDEWNNIIKTNLTGPFLITRQAIKHMLQNNIKGRIIHISSPIGKTGGPFLSAYAASKAGLISFVKSAAGEVASSGIAVNCICPGGMDTDMFRIDTLKAYSNIYNKPEDEILKMIVNNTPIKRLVETEEVARLALFLAGDKCGAIIGGAINITGGN